MLFFKKSREIKVSEYLDRELTDNQAIDISESLVFDPELNSLASDLFDTNTVVNNVLRKTNPTPNYPQISVKSTETSPGLHKKNLNLSPFKITAVGLIATAGIALIGLHRKGLIWRKS